jgi:hypothetical protein
VIHDDQQVALALAHDMRVILTVDRRRSPVSGLVSGDPLVCDFRPD